MTEQDKTETHTIDLTLTTEEWNRINQETEYQLYDLKDRVSVWITRHMHSDADTMWEDN